MNKFHRQLPLAHMVIPHTEVTMGCDSAIDQAANRIFDRVPPDGLPEGIYRLWTTSELGGMVAAVVSGVRDVKPNCIGGWMPDSFETSDPESIARNGLDIAWKDDYAHCRYFFSPSGMRAVQALGFPGIVWRPTVVNGRPWFMMWMHRGVALSDAIVAEHSRLEVSPVFGGPNDRFVCFKEEMLQEGMFLVREVRSTTVLLGHRAAERLLSAGIRGLRVKLKWQPGTRYEPYVPPPPLPPVELPWVEELGVTDVRASVQARIERGAALLGVSGAEGCQPVQAAERLEAYVRPEGKRRKLPKVDLQDLGFFFGDQLRRHAGWTWVVARPLDVDGEPEFPALVNEDRSQMFRPLDGLVAAAKRPIRLELGIVGQLVLAKTWHGHRIPPRAYALMFE